MIKRRVARVFFWATRWRVVGDRPIEKQYVLIAAPHTSNWDLVYMLAVSLHYGVSISWLGKESIFRGWRGLLMRRLGGIPVDRSRRSGMVETLAAAFAASDSLVVAVPPEGTRGRAKYWKSGFYQVAVAADVPVVCAYLDYSTRTGGYGPVVYPSGDTDADMSILADFYAHKRGKYPARESPVALRPDETTSG